MTWMTITITPLTSVEHHRHLDDPRPTAWMTDHQRRQRDHHHRQDDPRSTTTSVDGATVPMTWMTTMATTYQH